jgi:hypothetical protein
MKRTMKNILDTLRARLLPAVLPVAIVAALAGCSIPTASRPAGVASLGAVDEEPIDISEYLIEGPGSDGDGAVDIGSTTITLVRSPHVDLLAISDAAGADGDRVTQYAALHLATCLSPAIERAACWQRYALLFGELPPCGAAALADAIDDDVMLAESLSGGISADCSIAYRGRMARAESEFSVARMQYESAQGWVDDDEDQVVSARVHAHAAGVLNAGDSRTDLSLAIQQLLARTRGDLWENQANVADQTFVGGRAEWRRKIEWARQRALNTKLAYERGDVPARPVRRLD